MNRAGGRVTDRPTLLDPDGAYWRVNRESFLLLGGGAALLLQLAHPLVAAGVADHSNFRTEPVRRLYRTIRTMQEIIYEDTQRNTLQFKDYFRFDLKTNLTWNRPTATHELGIDFVNVLGTQNVLKLTYAPDEGGSPEDSIREEYQLGFLPIFFYRVDL